MSKLLYLFASSCVTLLATTAVSQVDQSYLNDTGSPAYSVNIPVENGYIDVNNGNLHLEFPIASAPQRGALKLTERLVYDSRIWMFSHFGSGSSYHWWPYNVYGASSFSGGWRFIAGNEVGQVNTGNISYTQNDCPYDPDYVNPDGYDSFITYGVTWIDPSGTAHPFNYTWTDEDNTCGWTETWNETGPTGDGSAVDGSGYQVTPDGSGGYIVKDSNGTEVYPQIIDRYGNYWSADGSGNLVDDAGRVPVIVTQSGNTTYYDVIAPNGPITNNGTRVRYTVTTAPVNVYTDFRSYNDSDIYPWISPQNPGDQPLLNPVQSIVLPDGSSYSFTYDWDGELASVTLPTGGVVHYGYANFVDSSNTENRWVNSRTLGDGPTESFTPSVVTSCQNYASGCVEHVTVHKPSGDETVYELTLNNGAWNTSTTVYNGPASNGQALLQATNVMSYTNGCYDFGTCTGGNYPYSSIATTELFATGVQPIYTQTQEYYDHYPDKPLFTRQWDYMPVTGTINTSQVPGTTPATETDYTYSGLDLQTVSVYDSSHNLAGQTSFGYTTTPAQITSNITQHGTQNAGGPYLNTITHWLNGGTSPITTIGMDDTGQVVSNQDAKNNSTTTSYQCANSLPLNVTNALNQTTSYTYDCNSGAITSARDPNDLANSRTGTQYSYEAAAGRLHQITSPDGGSTTYAYPSSTEVDTTVAASPDPDISSADILDQYGRPYQHSQNGITSESSYDGNGRSYCITNPHTSSPSSTDGSTCATSYDGLDRPLVQQQPDGNTVQSAYTTNTVTTTDEAGNQVQRTSDAFGRLTSVIETPSPGVSYTTNYTYDGLGNLYQINQLGRSGTDTPEVRTFVHDSLGRLASSTIPERGAATTYSYVSNGAFCSGDITLLCSETDARGITTSYNYDALNRLGHITYSDGTPGRWYEYDITSSWMGPQYNTIGRLAEANTDTDTRYTSGVSNPNSPYAWTDELYSYDAMGRVNRIGTAFPSESGHAAHETDMTYDLAGNMISLRYPDGRVITQGNDAAGHLQSVTFDNWNGQHVGYTYASGFTYTPAGAQAEVTYGNGIYIHTPSNDRQQVCQVWASNSTQPLIDTHIYFAGGTNFCVSAPGNNGNISQIKDWRNPAHTRYFGYDALNRLNSFTNGDGSMQQSYGYDSFGNLTQSGTLNFQVGYDANNHINTGGFGYDAAGNVTQVNVAGINTSYSFDGAGRLYNVNSGAAYYTYDGNGNRMRKDLNGSYTEYQYLNGQVIAERQSDGTWTDYIYANGQKIAKSDAARPLIHAHGVRDNTISMACGSVWWLSGSAIPAGYTIRSGDKLVFDQLETVAHAGPSIEFTDGTDTTWNQDPQNPVFLTFDQNGENTADSTQDDGQWHHRIIDLTPVVGKTISSSNNFAHATEADTPAGAWDVYYANMSLVSTDGTVQSIFTGQQISSSLWDACGGHDLSLATEPISLTTDPVASTTYFIGDQIGSTRMVAGGGGWPTSTSTFYPFGQQQSVAADSNHYKFTGLERDQQNGETGLDHATFRQYSSVQGRWMSPDPFDGSMNLANPQTLNRYSYVGNMPLNFTDPTGEFALCGASTALYVAATGGPPGAVGGGIACGISIAATVAKDIFDLLGLIPHHPHLAGTTGKRPKVLGSPDFGVPYHGLNAGVMEALGLPGMSCEFGVCGAGTMGYGPGNQGANRDDPFGGEFATDLLTIVPKTWWYLAKRTFPITQPATVLLTCPVVEKAATKDGAVVLGTLGAAGFIPHPVAKGVGAAATTYGAYVAYADRFYCGKKP